MLQVGWEEVGRGACCVANEQRNEQTRKCQTTLHTRQQQPPQNVTSFLPPFPLVRTVVTTVPTLTSSHWGQIMSEIVQQPDAHFPLCDVDDAIIKRQKRRTPAPSIKAAATPTTTEGGEGEEQQQQAASRRRQQQQQQEEQRKMVTVPGSKVKPHYALIVVVVVLTK